MVGYSTAHNIDKALGWDCFKAVFQTKDPVSEVTIVQGKHEGSFFPIQVVRSLVEAMEKAHHDSNHCFESLASLQVHTQQAKRRLVSFRS
jgi:hypothetical protein